MTTHDREFPGADAQRSVEAVRALARAARALERASSELNMAHYRVLSAIASGEDRASRVAERLELGRPAISAAVDALCRAGYLVRTEVKKDQRAFDLRLTDAGGDLLHRVEAEMVRLFDDLCQQTPDGDRLREDLASLGVALDRVAERRLAERRRTES